jgi:DNA invertase Pin-like site-specific DNA recombinase
MILGYARVSTDKQDLSNQLAALVSRNYRHGPWFFTSGSRSQAGELFGRACTRGGV